MSTQIFSQEDKDLDRVSIVTTRKRVYKDIDLSFNIRTTGDILKKTEAASVKQAIKTLLLTNRFEKPFEPNFGCDLSGMLFELADGKTGGKIIEKIKSSIETYEPRAIVRSVQVALSDNQNALNIIMVFQVKNTDQVVTFETTVSRLR